jgi:glycosyltransferase involved in cell wall biosynthesis
MKIGIDISQIVYTGTGVARFTDGLVNAILKHDTDNQWTFFFSGLRQKLPAEIKQAIIQKNHKIVNLPLPPKALSLINNDFHSFSKLLTFNFKLLTKLDWFITSDWTEPALPCKKATIVHDLVFKRFPETVDPTILKTQEKRLNWVTKESKIIFADSQATKDDIIDIYKIPSEKIIVNYPGVETKRPSVEFVNITKQKYNLNSPFILTVGKLEPRKNIAKLIEAFNIISQQHPEMELIIVGQKGWGTMEPVNNEKIRFLGHVSDEELYALYASSFTFVMPSIYEGFGYPAIEAMQLGTSVALSNSSSLKELGEGVAEFFDPNEVNSIAQSLSKLIEQVSDRRIMIDKGFKKAQQYSWQNYYNKLIDSLQKN